METDVYGHIRSGGTGYIKMPRGLIAVWGKEAVQFLDGMITNDMKTLDDGGQMLAAFPNAQGRLLALVRVLRQGDRFLIETEEATREKVFQNLFRFTFAGDFFVEDLSDQYRYFELFGVSEISSLYEGGAAFHATRGGSVGVFIEAGAPASWVEGLQNAVVIDDDTFEVLRIESGIPKFGFDMDETTIVPELGLDGMISYTKGCYIGQEIIARIHFRGHVAKQLTGLVFEQTMRAAESEDHDAKATVPQAAIADGGVRLPIDITTPDGKNAGRITSVTFSPTLQKTIALAFVRYDHLANGTMLAVGEVAVKVEGLPFFEIAFTQPL